MQPADPRVTLVEVPEMTVAALRFSRSTGDAAVSARIEELSGALSTTKWKASGAPTPVFL